MSAKRLSHGRIAIASIVAVSLAIAGIFWTSDRSPVVTLSNIAPVAVADLRIETDTGESYALGPLAAGGSIETTVSGRDKLLWVVGRSATGENLESNELYVTSGVVVAGVYDGRAIRLEARL